MTGQRLDDLIVAANEAVANVLQHAGGDGEVAMWVQAGQLLVEITDTAGRLSPEQAEHREHPPGSCTQGGRGLWLMRLVCDEFTVVQEPGRSRVRLRMWLQHR